MTGRVWSQPLVVVRDVEASSAFYADVLGLTSAHGGDEYDQLVDGSGELVMQLHDDGAEDHHGVLVDHDLPVGNGLLLWFEVPDIDATAAAVRARGAEVVRDLEVNPNAKQREIWFRDLDGYLLTVLFART